MALVLGDNFSYGGSKPLDARLKYNTIADMKAVADATMYDGCLAYCSGTDKTYQWKSTNTVDETLGKWREFSSGGGSGGHVIEDSEGTELTQRDTMQFGKGFIAEDDSENEKTVISADVMQSGDMDDVITPLPSVPTKLPILFDESGAERVVGWYKYSNGTKKPVYEKVLIATSNFDQNVTWGDGTIDRLVSLEGVLDRNTFMTNSFYISSTDHAVIYGGISQTQGLYARCFLANVTPSKIIYTFRYTKLTDTAE